jgi:hypothetical protein
MKNEECRIECAMRSAEFFIANSSLFIDESSASQLGVTGIPHCLWDTPVGETGTALNSMSGRVL